VGVFFQPMVHVVQNYFKTRTARDSPFFTLSCQPFLDRSRSPVRPRGCEAPITNGAGRRQGRWGNARPVEWQVMGDWVTITAAQRGRAHGNAAPSVVPTTAPPIVPTALPTAAPSAAPTGSPSSDQSFTVPADASRKIVAWLKSLSIRDDEARTYAGSLHTDGCDFFRHSFLSFFCLSLVP
jgi:hypothetical protein